MHHEVPLCKLKPRQQPETVGLLVKPIGGTYWALGVHFRLCVPAPQHVVAHTCIINTQQMPFLSPKFSGLKLQGLIIQKALPSHHSCMAKLFCYISGKFFSAVYWCLFPSLCKCACRSESWSCRRSRGGRRKMTSCGRSLRSTPTLSTSGCRRPGRGRATATA